MVEFTSSQQQFENKLNIADGSLSFVENTLGRVGAEVVQLHSVVFAQRPHESADGDAVRIDGPRGG